MAIKTFVSVDGSSLFDVCLNTYGTLDYLGKLIQDNPEQGLNLYPTAGTQFVWDDSLQISQTNAIIGGSGMFVGYKYATRPTGDPIPDYAPENILPPSLSGTIDIGSTVTCVPGVWSGLPTPTITHQWQSSTDGGVNWGDITGETSTTYVLATGDDTKLIRCNEIATNYLASASRASAYIAPYQSGGSSIPPSNATTPTIVVAGGGSAIVGAYLVCAIGTWLGTGAITYTFEWSKGSTVLGTSQIYQLQSGDFGASVKCKVTATNSFGTDDATTTTITVLDIPKNTVAPAVTGTTDVGSVLTTTNGTWTGNATITYTYQWLRNTIAISGETSSTYTSVLADMGQDVTCRVTATNSYGVGTAVSNATTVTKAPSNTTLPVVYGSTATGGTLNVFVGVWSAYASPSYTYNWQYSTNGGSTWSNYSPTQTGSTYTVVSGDAGNLIRCQVTATNASGNATANSQTIEVCVPPTTQRPVNSTAPVVSGTPKIGQTLSTTGGTWTNSPTSYTYQWQRAGSNISSATSSTYTLVSADVDKLITCVVTATNSGGNEPQSSNSIYAYDATFYAVIEFATAQGYTLPTTAQQQHFSRLVTELKANFMWSINDRFFVPANNGSSNFGRINWMNPTTGTLLTLVNSPTWTSNIGFVGNGTNAYIDTNFNPSTAGVNYTLNNAGRYLFVSSRGTSTLFTAMYYDGNSTSNDNCMATLYNTSRNAINQGTTANASTINSQAAGYNAITRTASNALARSNDVVQTATTASSAITSSNQFILRSGTTYCDAGIGFYAIGASIANADIPTHKSIISKYFNNL